MAIAFKSRRIDFDPTRGQIQREPGSVSFDTRVTKAEAVVKGWDIRYNNGDHEILRQLINIRDVAVSSGNRVDFTVEFLLRDSSGSTDDPFSGFVEVLIIADVEGAIPGVSLT